jgi:hypothetical protein
MRGIAEKAIFLFPAPYILFRSKQAGGKSYGFKLLFYQARRPAHLLSWFSRRKWLIIHIQRRNLFDQALSQIVGERTGMWCSYKEKRDPGIVGLHIPVADFLDMMTVCLESRKREIQALAGLDRLSVVYEDDLPTDGDRNRICARIFEKLGLDATEVSTKYRRSWNRPYSEVISNFDELADSLRTDRGGKIMESWDMLREYP